MFTEKDCLNRTKDIEAISNIINSMNTLKEYGSFALNGGWGTGKTYF